MTIEIDEKALLEHRIKSLVLDFYYARVALEEIRGQVAAIKHFVLDEDDQMMRSEALKNIYRLHESLKLKEKTHGK